MSYMIFPGQTYKHFKGNEYIIICVAMDTETLEEVVIYKDITKNHYWVRKRSEFEDIHPSGVKRFTFIRGPI